MRITASDDKKLPFVEFTLPLEGLGEERQAATIDEFIDFLTLSAASIGLGLYYRDSFGFNENTLAKIGNKVRLSPGTEPPDALIDLLISINRDLKEAQRNLTTRFNTLSYLQGANLALYSPKKRDLSKMEASFQAGAQHALNRSREALTTT